MSGQEEKLERGTMALRLVFLLDPFDSTVESDMPELPPSPENGPDQTGDAHTEGEWRGKESQNMMTARHGQEELKSCPRAPRDQAEAHLQPGPSPSLASFPCLILMPHSLLSKPFHQ